MCVPSRADVVSLGGCVAGGSTPRDPPAWRRTAVTGASAEPPQSTRTGGAGGGRWFDFVPGVTVKPLSVDIERDTATILMMFAPGARVPSHDHAGAEDSFVVSGSCRIGESYLLKGDFHHADAGTTHAEIVSDEGCVLLLVVDREDYLAA